MKVIIIVMTVLFLSSLGLTEDKQPKYEPMDVQDVAQWYILEVTKSINEDAQRMYWIALLTLSQEISCFDVEISTKPVQHRNPFWHPTWRIDGSNCVDKRIYNCEENNGK